MQEEVGRNREEGMGVGKRGAGRTEPPLSPASFPYPPHTVGCCQHSFSPAGHIWRLPAPCFRCIQTSPQRGWRLLCVHPGL